MRTAIVHALCIALAGAVGASVGYAVTGAAASAQTVPFDPERAAQMREHYNDAMTLHAAIIRGDFPAVTEAAQKLTQYEAPTPVPAPIDSRQGGQSASRAPTTAAHVTAIRAAAGLTIGARDISTAAYATALLLSTCGDCHRTVGTMPSVALRTFPEVGGIVGHMLDHQRAADQMLQGLVVPSKALWEAGARGLVSAPLDPHALPIDADARRKLADAEARVHRVARQAVKATSSRSRASFYGQVLGSCAECHQQHATVWGPAPPRAPR